MFIPFAKKTFAAFLSPLRIRRSRMPLLPFDTRVKYGPSKRCTASRRRSVNRTQFSALVRTTTRRGQAPTFARRSESAFRWRRLTPCGGNQPEGGNRDRQPCPGFEPSSFARSSMFRLRRPPRPSEGQTPPGDHETGKLAKGTELSATLDEFAKVPSQAVPVVQRRA